jgi:sortase (surface protein transpeptidase)
VLAFAALRMSSNSDAVILEVDSASAPTPSTVPPLPTTSPTTTVAAPETTAVVAPDGPPLSPLSELLGEQYSVIPESVDPRPRPVGIEIEAIELGDYPIRPVGLEPDGQLEVPDETEIGWYQYGATAGRPGSTVLAAHVSWKGSVGPFGALGNLEPGSQISVALDDGTVREYEVFERAIYGKLELPTDRIWSNTGPETLVLITCGGDFNPEIRRYRQNIVVYAAPVG